MAAGGRVDVLIALTCLRAFVYPVFAAVDVLSQVVYVLYPKLYDQMMYRRCFS